MLIFAHAANYAGEHEQKITLFDKVSLSMVATAYIVALTKISYPRDYPFTLTDAIGLVTFGSLVTSTMSSSKPPLLRALSGMAIGYPTLASIAASLANPTSTLYELDGTLSKATKVMTLFGALNATAISLSSTYELLELVRKKESIKPVRKSNPTHSLSRVHVPETALVEKAWSSHHLGMLNGQ